MSGQDISFTLKIIDAVENPALREEMIKQLQESDRAMDRPNFIATIYVFLDRDDLAIDTLEAGLLEGNPYATIVNVSPAFEALRDNPRFQAHLKKMNLWP